MHFKPIEAIKKAKYFNLYDDDGRSLSSDSLAELMRDLHLKDFSPDEMEIKIQQLSNTFTLNLKRRKFGALRYDVNCYDETIEHSIVYEIENWIDAHRPSKMRQVWMAFGSFIGLMALLVFVMLLTGA